MNEEAQNLARAITNVELMKIAMAPVPDASVEQPSAVDPRNILDKTTEKPADNS